MVLFVGQPMFQLQFTSINSLRLKFGAKYRRSMFCSLICLKRYENILFTDFTVFNDFC